MNNILIGTFVFFTLFLPVTVSAIPASTNTTVLYDGLPEEKEGILPIMQPTYENVEQLIVLSNRWLILITNNIPEVISKIDEFSKGEFKQNIDLWVTSQNQGKNNWAAKSILTQFLDKYLNQARELAGEKELDKIESYSITSETDPNYSQSQNPIRVTRTIVPIDSGLRFPGFTDIDYDQYSYLEMPFPLENGNTYTISLNEGKKVTFLYDELRTISQAIKVNQLGYLPDSKSKIAYLGGFLLEFGPLPLPDAKIFHVISATTGETVLSGEVKLRASDPLIPPKEGDSNDPKNLKYSGENIYEMDLTPLKEVGDFFISVPSVGRSWTFRHAPDVYGEAFYKSARALYHQRSGMAIEQPFSAWPRPAAHTDPVYESEGIPYLPPIKPPVNADKKPYAIFDILGYTIDTSKKTEDATGGWYDAADWDKNLSHYTNIFDLLYAYELFPKKFTDLQLNIPESGNGIPDILDEAEYGLKVWKKSMTAEGGVAGFVEAATHPTINDPNFPYAYSLRTRWSSLMYAAAAAQLSYLVAPYNAEMAEEYKTTALKAYEFGINEKNSLDGKEIKAAPNRGKDSSNPYSFVISEKEDDLLPFLIAAKLRLYILTKDKKYLGNLDQELSKTPKPFVHPFTNRDLSPWYYYSMFLPEMKEIMPEFLINKWRGYYLDAADALLKYAAEQPYRFTWNFKQYWWMSWGATAMTNYARVLLIAYVLTGEDKYREAAIHDLDFMLGANPKGMSWTTGIGFVYPVTIQHATSTSYGIKDPVQGIAIYGITEGKPLKQLLEPIWSPKDKDGKAYQFVKPENQIIPIWRNWWAHPTINTPQDEFTIHETISAAIFAYALLMPEGWMPSEKLKQQNPRQDKFLYGYWYLP